MQKAVGQNSESIICILEDGREIEITLLELNGNQARIGIDADDAIHIVRNELLDFDLGGNEIDIPAQHTPNRTKHCKLG
jgi:sRNA-binding carbon storage regulator CsrA